MRGILGPGAFRQELLSAAPNVGAMTKAIPDSYHSLTTTLVVDGGSEAIEFYERAFGAEVHTRMTAGDKIVFAALRIGPFGHRWALATHVEDLSEEEMQKRIPM